MNTFSSGTRTHPAAGSASTDEREFLRLAAALADWPGLVRRILDRHDATGTCRACTTPGGRMVIEAPCAPRSLAMQAQRISDESARLVAR